MPVATPKIQREVPPTPKSRPVNDERLEVVCSEWSREDLLSILSTLKSVRTGRIEIMLREHHVVGVVRHPFPFAGRVYG